MAFAEIREHLFPWAAPTILLAIAALQAYNVRAYELTPWKGGGFGMFSTVDEPDRRVVRCYLVADDGRETPLRIPQRLQRFTWEVRAIPTADRVARLAREVAADFSQSVAKAGVMVGGRHVRARVWRVAFDAQANRLQMVELAEQTVER